MLLTKTNYLVFKECPQNAWVKIFRPEIYQSKRISDFNKMIMESGNQVNESVYKFCRLSGDKIKLVSNYEEYRFKS